MNLIDMRIFSTQLMLYLNSSCHSLTTHINKWSSFGQWSFMQGY